MANARRITNTFIAGEIGPRSLGRTDLENYYKAAARIENWIIMKQGGLMRRPGFRFITKAKFQDGKNFRLTNFPSTAGDNYTLEWGHLYLRFYYDGAQVLSGGVPLEIATPYVHTDLFDLHFAQIGDVLRITHKSYAPRKLQNNNGVFSLNTIAFNPPPTNQLILKPTATLTPSATTGSAITFTASSAIFLDAYLQMVITNLSASGKGTIVTVTAPPTATASVTITEDFSSTAVIASQSWSISGFVNATATPSVATPVSALVTVTLNNNFFTSDMIGMYIKLNSGLLRITFVNSPTVATAQILVELTGITAAAIGAWSIETDAWANDPPRTIAFHENRVDYAANSNEPHTVWTSKTDDYDNIASGAKDSDSIQVAIVSGEISEIQWLMSADDLLAGTLLQEMRLISGDNKALTPSNTTVRSMSTEGSAHIQAIKWGASVIFIGAGSATVREIQFDLQSNSIVPRDLTLLADHIPAGNIVQMFRHRRPYGIIWIINGEKKLCALELDYVEKVLNWSRCSIDGQILTATATPQFTNTGGVITRNTYEDLYVGTKRNINGIDTYFVERADFTPINFPKQVTDQGVKCFTDCSIVQNNSINVSTVEVSHLIGETVSIAVDGADQGDQIVPPSGVIALTTPGKIVDVGLPMVSTLQTLPVDFPSGRPLMGERKRWTQIHVLMLNTLSLKVNDERIALRRPNDLFGNPVPVWTQDYYIKNFGFDDEARINIVADRPLNANVLAAHGELEA